MENLVQELAAIWGADVARRIETRAFDNFKVMSFDSFLDHCTACGGNWGGMLLTGLKELYPTVWDAVPDKMGSRAWDGICLTLAICGVQTGE